MGQFQAPIEREIQYGADGDAGRSDSDEFDRREPSSVAEAVQRARSTQPPQGEPGTRVQRSLRVGSADDPEEREADRVAERVVARIGRVADPASAPSRGEGTGHVHRTSDPGVPRVRRSAGPSTQSRAGFETDDTFTREVSGSSGSPIEAPVRREMESAFGHDFSKVRIHTGSRPDRLSRQIDAAAFTQANNVFFANGNYDPGSAEGAGLLAHELTHVVQQSSGGPARRSVIRRRLSSESTAAFRTAVRSNPAYGAKRDLVDKHPASDDDNLTEAEQRTINDLTIGRLAKLRTRRGRTGAPEEAAQLDALGDLIRARNLSDLAERTAALALSPVGKGHKLETEGDRAKRRRFYLKKAKQQRNKDKNLLRLGVAAPETRQYLKEHGFTRSARDVRETTNPVGPAADQADRPKAKTRPDDENALGVSIRQDVSEWVKGPRIDVRSTFIGGPILGIMVRAHLFIVYTGRDGRQMYFRGGPSELGHTFADMGEYTADTVDYDPSAPSVTVATGDEAEAKLDALVNATKRVNAMRVPYEAQIAPGPLKGATSTVGEALGTVVATDGENCNRTAWTILNAAGVSTRKPGGKHPGWGKPLGATIGGELGMRDEDADHLSRPINHTLSAAEADGRGLFVQSFIDRALFQKKAKLPVGDTVQIIAEGSEYRTVLWNGEKHFIAKSDDEQHRYDIFTVRDHLQSKGWSADQIRVLLRAARDDTAHLHAESLQMLYELEHEMGVDLNTIVEAMDLHLDDNDLYMREELDKLSDGQLKEMLTNLPRLLNFARLIHQPSGLVMAEVRTRVGRITAAEDLQSSITAAAPTDEALNQIANDYPDYAVAQRIADELGRALDDVLDAVDDRRPAANQGKYLEYEVAGLSPEDIKGVADGRLDASRLAAVVGVSEDWLVTKFKELVPALPPPPVRWAEHEVGLMPDGSQVPAAKIALGDAKPLLTNAMAGPTLVSVVYRGGFWNVTTSDFELIRAFHAGELIDGARPGEAAPVPSGEAVLEDEAPAPAVGGERVLEILDDYTDKVVRTMTYDLAKGELSASQWPRPSDTHMDVTYDMGTNGRVVLADWVEFQRFVTGDEAPAPASKPSADVVTDSPESADELSTEAAGPSVTTDDDERLRLYPIVLAACKELAGFDLSTLGAMFDAGGGFQHGGEAISMDVIYYVLEVDGPTRSAAMAAALECDVDDFLAWLR